MASQFLQEVLHVNRLTIEGGVPLEGSVRVHGAKNAVLPILAATILNRGVNVIHDCPDLKDVRTTMKILTHLGASVKREGSTVIVNTEGELTNHIPDALMREMRSSIFFMGAILSRCKSARISAPGGCELGPRPIDLHIKALGEMGAKIQESHGYINCEAEHLVGTNIHLAFPSVGATENVLLAAVFADGKTTVTNAAKEPEIADLAAFLNQMGADIRGAGTGVVEITGVKELHGAEHTVIPDRIVATTYLAAAAATHGNVTLTNVIPAHNTAVLSCLKDCGCSLTIGEQSVTMRAPRVLAPLDYIKTLPYPGFPTDAQSPMMAMLTVADGTSIVAETIFESRFKHVEELVRMGADIKVDGRVAVIRGVPALSGATVTAMDLRGGAALVVAGLAANGLTEISNLQYIDRGYEDIEHNLRSLGARIRRA